MVRGMIIKESLADSGLLSEAAWKIVERYPMRMDGKFPIEIVMVDVHRDTLLGTLEKIGEGLLPVKFYAHFVDGAIMYVVYPGTVSVVRRGDAVSARRCIEVGRLFEVPEAQLSIEKMFQFGHTEHPD